MFKHLREHLPWLLMSRQAWRNKCVGNEWRQKLRLRERSETRVARKKEECRSWRMKDREDNKNDHKRTTLKITHTLQS